jgi:hypothetical protein
MLLTRGSVFKKSARWGVALQISCFGLYNLDDHSRQLSNDMWSCPLEYYSPKIAAFCDLNAWRVPRGKPVKRVPGFRLVYVSSALES